jgi:DNA-binding response OmpR family regulator
MRILLVEDEAALRVAYADHFERAGHEVDTAVSRQQAMELLRTRGYDAAAIDLVLVQSTGDTVAEAAHEKGTGVVLMSAATKANALEDVREILAMKGCRVYAALKKPFVTPGVLMAALEGAAAEARLARQETATSAAPVAKGEGKS